MGCHFFSQRLSNGFRGYIRSRVVGELGADLQYDKYVRSYTRQRVAIKQSPTKPELKSSFAIQQQLKYLGDPLKLSEYVSSLLMKDKFPEAEQLLRAASKDKQYTVGWNHLINYQLQNGKVNGAYKTYNEMKKRAQVPDAHTYTILFRGLAENANYPLALAKALSIYHSMDAANSPVRPSPIHTNAVLKVCARAGDMDAMFGIAAKLGRKGLRAPNNLTFTTILNAVRQDATRSILNGESNEAALSKAILNARLMWDDIVARWRQGDMRIDEELVCSMGRILLLGKKSDFDDIFSLIEQTMQVPRIFPRLRTPEQEPYPEGKRSDTAISAADDSGARDLSQRYEFRAIIPLDSSSESLSAYAKPGQNTISLVLEALYKLRLSYPLKEYWDIFTKQYGARPDSQNFHSYLRNLRFSRASKETVEMLQQMPSQFFAKKTFRIAMSTCLRDKNNSNSFSHAEKILTLMEERLPETDLHALQSYLQVALTSEVSNNRWLQGQQKESKYSPQGMQIKQALSRLCPHFINVKSTLADERMFLMKDVSKANEFRESAVALARDMIGAYDKLIINGMVDKECHGVLIRRRRDLAAFVTEYNHKYIHFKGKENFLKDTRKITVGEWKGLVHTN